MFRIIKRLHLLQCQLLVCFSFGSPWQLVPRRRFPSTADPRGLLGPLRLPLPIRLLVVIPLIPLPWNGKMSMGAERREGSEDQRDAYDARLTQSVRRFPALYLECCHRWPCSWTSSAPTRLLWREKARTPPGDVRRQPDTRLRHWWRQRQRQRPHHSAALRRLDERGICQAINLYGATSQSLLKGCLSHCVCFHRSTVTCWLLLINLTTAPIYS